jgi:predicted PurR-regulated permease PerM
MTAAGMIPIVYRRTVAQPVLQPKAENMHSDIEEPVARPDKQLRPFQARFFLFLLTLAALILGGILWPFWQFLLLSFLLSGIFRPVYQQLNRWVPSWTASLLTCTLITLIVFLPLIVCISEFLSEAIHLYRYGRDTNVLLKLQQLVQDNILITQAQAVLKGFGLNLGPIDVPAIVSGLSKTVGVFIYNQAAAWAANIVNFALQFCMLVMVSFFLLRDIDYLIDFLIRLSPLPKNQNKLLMEKFMEIAGSILIGNGLNGLLQGVLGGVFIALLGLKAPVFYGVVMGVLAFLPLFGIGLVLVPTAAILLLNGFFGQAAATLLFYLSVTFSVKYLIQPRLFRSRVKMHTLLIFLSIIGGVSLFGILGVIYGPLIVTAFLTLAELYLHEYRSLPAALEPERHNLPSP